MHKLCSVQPSEHCLQEHTNDMPLVCPLASFQSLLVPIGLWLDACDTPTYCDQVHTLDAALSRGMLCTVEALYTQYAMAVV